MELNRDKDKKDGGIVDVLFDKNNTEDIVLVNERGEELAFRQIYAAIKDDIVYCILAPAEEVKHMPENGAFVFALSRGQDLTVVKDSVLSDEIFSEYYHSLRRGDE